MRIEFETELELDGTPVHAVFGGAFEINRDGNIDEITLEVWDRGRFRDGKVITGPLFDLLKPHLAKKYEGDIIDALYDMRDSAAATHADRENDRVWADF